MLTRVQIRKARPEPKCRKLSGGSGLHLLGTRGKLWRFRDQFGGKEKLLAIGSYPELSLADARLAPDEAKPPCAAAATGAPSRGRRSSLSRRRAARPSWRSPASLRLASGPSRRTWPSGSSRAAHPTSASHRLSRSPRRRG
nr:Arm DNA-binding domain-containing protein [Enterovirga sp.]